MWECGKRQHGWKILMGKHSMASPPSSFIPGMLLLINQHFWGEPQGENQERKN